MLRWGLEECSSQNQGKKNSYYRIMKKLVLSLLFLAFISTASATAITHENVTIDLDDSSFKVGLEVQELTSESLTYVVGYPISDLEGRINGADAACYTKDLQIGSEIHCQTNSTENFSAEFEFTASDISKRRGNINYFQFSRIFRVPTDNYRLKALLPEDASIVDEDNISQPSIYPETGQTGSDGQRIFVVWETNPELGGEPTAFSIFYNDTENSRSLFQYIGIGLLILVAALLSYTIWSRFSKIEISEAYETLNEDQEDIINLLIENDGRMLQKDVVDSSKYSKAKVSGLVSELVEKGVIEKEKEGRSNKLMISAKYKY